MKYNSICFYNKKQKPDPGYFYLTARVVTISLLIMIQTGPFFSLYSPVSAQASDDPKYLELVKLAISEYKSKRWAQARALFEKAHAINPNAQTLRGIAIAAFETKDYVSCLKYLNESLIETRKSLSNKQRFEAEQMISKADESVGRFMISISPPGAELSVDGELTKLKKGELLLNPGEHEIQIYRSGYQIEKRQLLSKVGRTREIEIYLIPDRKSESQDKDHDETVTPTSAKGETQEVETGSGAYETIGWIGVGTSAVTLGGSIVAYVIWDKSVDDWNNDKKCLPDNRTDRQENCGDVLDNIKKAEIWMAIGLTATGAFALSSLVFFLLDADESESSKHALSHCTGGPGELGMSCRFQF